MIAQIIKDMNDKKKYIIRKYVLASSIEEELKLEKTAPVDDIILEKQPEEPKQMGYNL